MEDARDIEMNTAGRPAPVVAARCADYEPETVQRALREVLAPLGGMAAFVKPGERVALKPNILLGAAPDQAITTHPAVVAAVALEVREAGAVPVVVESPGAGIVFTKSALDRAYGKAGLREAADRYGFELNMDVSWEAIPVPEGRTVYRVEVMSAILAADGVLNLAKLKTHNFMIFTGAVKNLFGVIPGLSKVGYHGKLADPELFAGMLLDVAAFVRPRLNLVDAVLALEGKGPGTAGSPRRLGLLLAGADPVTVDVACCRVVAIDTAAVPVLAVAKERGLWSGRAADVDTLGVPVAELQVRDFELPSKQLRETGVSVMERLEGLGRPLLRGGFSPRPRPKAGRCELCDSCKQACPTKAITLDEKAQVAKVDDSLCIRCYCCHEVCPSAAIDLEYTGLGRLMRGLGVV